MTSKIEYADGGATPYRRTRWGYYPNTSKWIVNKPGYENVDTWGGST